MTDDDLRGGAGGGGKGEHDFAWDLRGVSFSFSGFKQTGATSMFRLRQNWSTLAPSSVTEVF